MKVKVVPIALLVAAAFGAGAGVSYFPDINVHAATAAAPVAVQTLPDFSVIVEANKAAVVNITASKALQPAAAQGDPRRRFQIPQIPGMPEMPQQRPAQGLGSGFIVEAEGVILTNAHVVEGADEVLVKLSDRREFKGKVLGADRATDIAVVKIEAKGLPTVKLGDPRSVRVGEWVLAIGSPFGFDNTATAGIVSATSRSLPDGTYVPFIQTDAAVNPGNSGGPLFNLKGEVIGINSQIYSRTGGYQGISFAIPINVAADVKQQLVKNGRVERGRIGVSIQDLTQSLAQSFGLEQPHGALVSSVEQGGPADKAGIKAGDVVLAVDGKKIERSAELPPLVAGVKPGSKASIELWREGRKQTLGVTVAELKAEQSARAPQDTQDSGKLGLAVRPGSDGLVVENAAGPAARAGIRQGDVVTAVNGKPVTSAEDLRSAVSSKKGTVALLIKRGEATLFVPVEIG
jgi:serine protease Do